MFDRTNDDILFKKVWGNSLDQCHYCYLLIKDKEQRELELISISLLSYAWQSFEFLSIF
jgi:hypothetical protein